MLEVTDKGWAWAGDHLDAELPKRSVYGAAILQAWLKQLKTFMTAKGFVLADVLVGRRRLRRQSRALVLQLCASASGNPISTRRAGV